MPDPDCVGQYALTVAPSSAALFFLISRLRRAYIVRTEPYFSINVRNWTSVLVWLQMEGHANATTKFSAVL